VVVVIRGKGPRRDAGRRGHGGPRQLGPQPREVGDDDIRQHTGPRVVIRRWTRAGTPTGSDVLVNDVRINGRRYVTTAGASRSAARAIEAARTTGGHRP
jgi:hypothetical protein